MGNSRQLQGEVARVLQCEVQDSSGLNDFQKTTDKTMIPIPSVGVEQFHLPITIRHPDGTVMGHDAVAAMAIALPGGKTGANMSRFCSILQEELGRTALNPEVMQQILGRFRQELRDHPDEAPMARSFLTISFRYPVKQPSLVSSNWGWQSYPVEYRARDVEGQYQLSLQVEYLYSSTCPCSLSLARQYERDYREGKTSDGQGIAVPHGQRSLATVRVHFSPGREVAVEELVQLLRQALPTETQSLVKRVDEQAFAVLNGSNPLFVEHAARRISQVLDAEERIVDWWAKVEHLESLHGHNAVATIQKRSGAAIE